VTLVSWGRMMQRALDAAGSLSADGVGCDVIDLRWLCPLDLDAVLNSVGRTGRLLIVHEANLTGGFGAEVAARVGSEAFWDLDAPVARLGVPDVRLPAAPLLQEVLLPSATSRADAVRKLARV
jgi:acetoin:2,6-dichlorophenolindophenol oxidoreductase subunit beta